MVRGLKLLRIAWWAMLVALVDLLIHLRAVLTIRVGVALALIATTAWVAGRVPLTTANPILGVARVGGSTGPIAIDARTGRAFVIASSDRVVMLDTMTGGILGTTVVAPGHADLAINPTTNRVFVVNDPYPMTGFRGSVSVLDARNGRLLRTVPLPGIPYAVVMSERLGRVFVLNINNYGMSILDARSGQVLGTVPMANGGPLLDPRALAIDDQHGLVYAALGSNDGYRMAVVNARLGTLVHLTRVGTGMSAPAGPIAVDPASGHAYTVSNNGLNMLDTSGRIARTIRGLDGGAIVDSHHGRLIVSTSGGIAILDSKAGRLLKTVHLGKEFAEPLAVDEASGRILVAVSCPCDANWEPIGDASLYMIDEMTGAVLHYFTGGRGPAWAAVDPRTGHAFVSNAGDGTVTVLDLRD
ncbi:MAG TPA: YncE family protein [Chloroflexota bacterium]|nr:YncE family protein [Chloroflexota bacterium]